MLIDEGVDRGEAAVLEVGKCWVLGATPFLKGLAIRGCEVYERWAPPWSV
jgi:hypothetical protein